MTDLRTNAGTGTGMELRWDGMECNLPGCGWVAYIGGWNIFVLDGMQEFFILSPSHPEALPNLRAKLLRERGTPV